jgi:hypothetical protein
MSYRKGSSRGNAIHGCSGCPGFESRAEDRLIWLMFERFPQYIRANAETESGSGYNFIHSSMTLQPFISVIFFTQTVGLHGRVISPSQGRYLHTELQRQNKRAQTSMPLSGIRTHDPSVRTSADSSCLRPRGYCDRLASERAKTVHASDRAATVTG